MTGAVASERVTEAPKGSLSADGNRAKSAKAEGSLTARRTGRAAGVIGLTKSAARELAGRKITVNAVAPGFIRTEITAVLSEKVKEKAVLQIPMERFGEAEDVAQAVAFLASEQAGYITGQVLCVDGGMAM